MARKKKSGKRQHSPDKPMNVKKEIKKLFENNPSLNFNYKQLSGKLGIDNKKDREKVIEVMEDLFDQGIIHEVKPGKFKHKPQSHFITGIMDMTRHGYGFVINEEFEEDIFIPASKTKKALSGDEVKVLIYAKRKGKRIEGEVVELLKRSRTEFVGILEISDKFAFLVPDSRKMDVDIYIPLKHIGEAVHGEKVLVKLTDWPEDAKSPFGKVIKVLGKAGENEAEMNAIMAEFGLPVEFPSEIEEEAELIPEEIPEEEIARRLDLRNVTTFTIDPDDAKDFDDALSLRKLDNGNWEVGVHIADVTYYVREGSLLDEEAFERGTSVYLVDRVIPMLPEKLSNKVCSLRPHEEKLCFSAIFEMNDNAKIEKEWFGKTIILSDKRFSYEEAQEILEKKQGEYSQELLTLNSLAKELRKKKFAEGAISFETEEVKFKLDENGKPLEVIKKIRKEAHMLIEDFMLLANKKVAEFIFKKDENLQNTPFVYRVHDAPPADKLENFVRIARQFGYNFETRNPKDIALSFNRLLERVEGKPEQNMLESLAIRTMSKALYTTTKSSHYGLAFDYYTHFTSPIRRYPDVIAHRLLNHYLTNDKRKIDQDKVEAQCKHASEMEVRASEAERASIKFKQVEYMKDHVGEEFEGIISGVIESSLFVELLENKCEGRVLLSSLDDDYYVYEEDNYAIRGVHSGKRFQMGDKVMVKIMEANPVKRSLIMEITQMVKSV